MKTQNYIICAIFFALFFVKGAYSLFATESENLQISGRLQSGYRLLTVPVNGTEIQFTVYRGDYIKFDLGGATDQPVLAIPSLSIQQSLNSDYRDTPYFKMKEVGSYPFTIGHISGEIKVVEFDRPQYAVLTADEAAQLIQNISPVVLDVRTVEEYKSGHLENSINIPVQNLQQRYTDLLQYKDEDVFIYCATGNRSTVAAKILIDNGFTRIHNLRYGIFDWARKGYPVTQ